MTDEATTRVSPEKYTFVTKEGLENDPTICITDVSSYFNGVVYSYNNIGVKEVDNNASLSFEYDIHYSAGMTNEEFDDDFVQLIGDILADQIDIQIKNDNVKYVKHIE